MGNKRYRHIIWDWNGTLLDDAWLCTEILNQMLVRYEMQAITLKEYQEGFCFPVRDYYSKLGFDFKAYPYERIASEYIKNYNSRRLECGLRDKAEFVINELGAAGVKQSVLSAYEQKMLEEVIGHFALKGHFTNIVGLSDHYAHSKAENGRKLVESMEERLEEVVLVGDTLHDLEVADSMGIDCVLVESGHQSRQRLKKAGAKVLKSLAELLESSDN